MPSLSSLESPKILSIQFDEPQKGVALGQVAVLWDKSGEEDAEWCLGCGVIDRASSVLEMATQASESRVERTVGVKDWQWW